MNKFVSLPLLAVCCLLASCSSFSGSSAGKSLAKVNLKKLNPFRAKVPLVAVSEEDLDAMDQDRDAIASHNVDGLPDASLRPVDFEPGTLPEGYDQPFAGLLPAKSSAGGSTLIDAEGELPEHNPIIPDELLDAEDDELSESSPTELIEKAPLVPFAPDAADAPKKASWPSFDLFPKSTEQ